jgi:hypothetical protein
MLETLMNSKNKGNIFERKIANLLSKRFATITGKEKSFARATDSGSFFGGTNRSRMVTHNLDKANFGDIVCPLKFRYNIECKHYKTPPNIFSLIDGSIREWDVWIAQASQDCTNAGKKMAIIIKYNNMKEIVILNELPDIACAVQYQANFVVSLETFLSIPDEAFFDCEPV